ncbi:hypothetical protein BGZ82_002762 [Podila clonocystis]|nr:hypothetical protein BGZ82_002762 [Podila clonocystis]
MDVIGIDRARKNPLDNDDDDAMNEDGEEYQMNSPSGQTHGIGGTSTNMNAAPGALQSSTSELMHDLMSQMQMIPEDSNMFGVEGDSSLAPSSSFKGTHRITRSGSSFASISRMSIDGVSANSAPGSGAGALGGNDMERSGSSGWWPGSGSQMSSTPTTSTTTATVIATSQSKTTLSSSLSTFSTASTSSSSGTGSGAPVAESAGRTAGHSNKNANISKKSLSAATGATLSEFAPSSKGEKSKTGSEKDTVESAKKPPLSLTIGVSKQHKKNGSSGSSLGSLFSSSFSNMTASLTSKKKRHSGSILNQQLGDANESAKGQERGEKKSNKGEKHSLSPSPSSSAFRPGHPRRSSSILDEFAEVMLNIATKKP